MGFSSYIEFLKKLWSIIPFNLFDYIILFLLIIYVVEDASFGIVPAGISLLSVLSAFLIGLIFYHPISEFIIKNFFLTKGIADALGFLTTTIVGFLFISMLLSLLRKQFISLSFPKKIDTIGGALLGALSFFFIASFAVALLLSFPVSEVIKNSIRDSVSGRFLFTRTSLIENRVRKVFGGAIEDTINFLTIKPNSNDLINLNFSTTSYKTDGKSETEMLRLVNIERRKINLGEVMRDERLTDVARAHAKDMLENGYFSHYTKEGLSPFDRIEMANIVYQYAGENLAFAPDVEIAMGGFMKSPGHRANMLSANFKKAGIGVLDAGIFGKMFVQEFTD